MDGIERNSLVYRIVSNKLIIQIGEKYYDIIGPSAEHRYFAEIVAKEVFDKSVDLELTQDTKQILINSGSWTEKMEFEYKQVVEDIEDLHIAIYKSSRHDENLMYRNNLKRFKERQTELNNILHSLDYTTAEGLANMARFNFLMGCSIYIKGRPIWKKPLEDYKRGKYVDIVDQVALQYASLRITADQMRQLVTSDPWISIWKNAKIAGCGLFNCSAGDMSDDQRSICSWSQLYDNIYADPNRPEESILLDPDALDGWLILRRREANKEELKKKYGLDNPKFIGKDEVYIMVDKDNVEELESLNSEEAKRIKQQRFKTIREKGTAVDADFADTALKRQMARARGN